METFKFKAGKYYIGDPCYVIPDKDWEKYLQTIDPSFNFDLEGTSAYGEWKNEVVYHESTAHGDGTYYDNFGREYGVDAGIIGIIPISILTKKAIKEIESRKDLAHFVTFDKDFNVYRDDNGTFFFGNITIETNPEQDEEECRHCGDSDIYDDDLCYSCWEEENYGDEEEDETT